MATTDNLYSGLNWNDLLTQAQKDQMAQWTRNDSFDPFSGGSTNIPGIGQAQIYLQPTDSGSMWDNASFNLNNDPNAPEGYATKLYQNPDGTVGHQYYQQDNNMAGMLTPFLAAFGAAYLPELLGAAGAGAGGGAAAGGAGGAGITAAGDAALGTGFQAAGGLGMQATGGLGLTTAGASTGALGSLAPGFFSAETLGGLSALTPSLMSASTSHLGDLAPGSFTSETLGGLAPLTPSVMLPDTSYLGSLGNGYFPGETLTGLPSGYTPTFPPTPGTPNSSLPTTPIPPVTPSSPTSTGTSTSPGTTTNGTGALNSVGNLINSPLGATLAGAALSGLNGAHQAGTTTTTQEPWSPLQPYLRDLYANAQSTYNANRSPTAAETSALQAIQQRATAGSPLQTAANTNIRGLLGQDPTQTYGIGQANPYTGRTINVGTNPMMGLNNPYLQTEIDNAQQDVIRAMQPQFAAAQRTSGSFGNSGLQETYARELPTALGRISNNMRMTDYGAQQQLQENALNRSVSAQQADLARNSGLAQQGIQNNLSQYNNMLGLQTNAAFNAPGLAAADYNDPQMAYNTARSAREANFLPLQQYRSALSGNPGGTLTSPYFTNPAANILGGATAGLGLWGAANKSGLLSGNSSYNNWLGNNSDWMNSSGFTPSGLLGSF